jgi:hypothetical protein
LAFTKREPFSPSSAAPVEKVREGRLGAGDSFRDGDGRIVAGLDEQAAQEVPDRDTRMQLGVHGRTPGRRPASPPGVLRDLEFLVLAEPARLELVEDVFRRHQLGHGSRMERLVGRLFEKNSAAVVIDDDRVRRLGLEGLRKRGPRGCQQAEKKPKQRRAQEHAGSDHRSPFVGAHETMRRRRNQDAGSRRANTRLATPSQRPS